MKKLYLLLVLSIYTLSMFAQSNQRFVLFEHFTNTTCPACGNKNPVFFDEIYEPYIDDIIHVEFHHNYPVMDLDPFNLFNQSENNERFQYYGSPGQPRMVMNGSLIPVQTGQPLVPVNTFLSELGQTSPLAIEVSEVTNGVMRDVTVEVHTLNPGLVSTDLVLRVGVVEKYILFPTYFENEFHNVFRQWLNSSDGTDYTPAAMGSSMVFNFSYMLDPSWQADEIYTIAYIQDNTTKEVINGGKSIGPGTPPALNIGTLNQSDILCPGDDGFIEVQAAGGCPPYTFEWIDGFGNIVGSSSSIMVDQAGEYTLNTTDNCGGLSTSTYIVNQVPEMSITGTILPETDNDMNGSIDIAIAGGTAPYSYIWNNGDNTATLENLNSGVYLLTIVDDNGCAVSQSFTVPQLSNTLSISYQSAPSCLGQDNGTASITVQGGNMPYTYEWSNGSNGQSESGLAPGNYIVIITDANGFDAVEIVLIEEITYSSNITTTSDINGSSNGSVSIGINSSSSYIIVDAQGNEQMSFENLPSGDYTYFLDFGNGCIDELAFSIDVLNYTIVSTSNPCAGETLGQIGLEGLEPDNLSINWSTGSGASSINNLADGNYCVVISNGAGTTVSECIDISSPDPITLSAEIIADDGSGGGSISIEATGGNGSEYFYSWSNGEESDEITGLSQGSYTVTVTDINGCSQSETFTIDAISGLSTYTVDIDIYPNPSSDYISIDASEVVLAVQIIDAQGRYLSSSNAIHNIDISKLNIGIYMVHIQTVSGTYLHRIVKSN